MKPINADYSALSAKIQRKFRESELLNTRIFLVKVKKENKNWKTNRKNNRKLLWKSIVAK